MKMYKKSDLSLVDGLLLAEDGTIVKPVGDVIAQANELDTLYQKAMYLKAQPAASPMPSLAGFERKSNFDIGVGFTADTPLLDKKSEEAMKLMEEIDDYNTANEVNKFLEGYADLIRFAASDKVVCSEDDAIEVFDTPALGDPLEISVEAIQVTAALIHGLTIDDDE